MSVIEVALKPRAIANDKASLVRPEALIGRNSFRVDRLEDVLIEVPSPERVWT